MRISRCQLGLFGFAGFDEKHLTDWVAAIPPELREQLAAGTSSAAITCFEAWQIADDLGIPRILVGAAANKLGIRINHCQLGCF